MGDGGFALESSPLLLVAAGAMLVVGVMHSLVGEWLGDRRLVRRMTRSSAFDARNPRDVFAIRIIRLAWHVTSLTWCGIGAILAFLAGVDPTPAVVVTIRILALTFLCCAMLSLVIARGQHLSWIVFLVAAVCSFLATLT